VPKRHSAFSSVSSRPPPLSHTTPTPRSTRIQEEMRFKVLRALERHPVLSQREPAEQPGVGPAKTSLMRG
jgi:hypothetical protein